MLVLRTLDPPSADDVARLRTFELRHRLRFYLQPAGLDSIAPLTSDAEIGPDGPSRALDYSLPEFDLSGLAPELAGQVIAITDVTLGRKKGYLLLQGNP